MKNTLKIAFYADKNPEYKVGYIINVSELGASHQGLFKIKRIIDGGAANKIAFARRLTVNN